MGRLNLIYKNVDECATLSRRQFARFRPDILGIGEISEEATIEQGVAAMFDLEGFTDFCNQVDPHLVVPEFLEAFLSWLFETLGQEFVSRETKAQIVLWCPFPVFAKFMGDGILFIWNSETIHKDDLCNLVVTLYEVCEAYMKVFLPKYSLQYAKIPKRLRCGIARGQVFGIGGGEDYVGACINVAARLQKLGNLSFAFSRRGFDLRDFDKDWWKEFILVQAPIRGVGEKEPVYVVKSEFTAMPKQQRDMFDNGSVQRTDI